MGVDGTLKDNVMYHEVDSENTFYWRYHHVGIYNVSPLEYCIWTEEYQTKRGKSWINIMVVDSSFNLISSRLLDKTYSPDMMEVVYCDEDHYMLSSNYISLGINPQHPHQNARKAPIWRFAGCFFAKVQRFKRDEGRKNTNFLHPISLF